MQRIAIIGDLAVDIGGYLKGEIKIGSNVILNETKISTGGVAVNMAWYLYQFGQRTMIIGSVGKDCWGKMVRNDLASYGANCSLVRTVSSLPTGFFVIAVDNRGERTMIGERGANKIVKVSATELIAGSPSWIHVSGYTLLNKDGSKVLNEVKIAAKKLGITYSVDLEGIGETDAELDLKGALVLCNVDRCDKKIRQNAIATVIKAGSQGCYLDYQGEIKHYKPPPAKLVDTTGAGDSFNSAFIYARLMGHNYDFSCDFANAVAAYKVGNRGAKIKIPENYKSFQY